MRCTRILSLIAVIFMFTPQTASAIVVGLEQFVVMRNDDGANTLDVYFNDQFDDGLAPESSPGTTENPNALYFTQRDPNPLALPVSPGLPAPNFVEDTSGTGRLIMDGALGQLRTFTLVNETSGTQVFDGDLVRIQSARLLSSQSAGSDAGLRANDDIEVRALFDLVEGDFRTTNYGIGLIDGGGLTPFDDRMRLSVLKAGNDTSYVQFFENTPQNDGSSINTTFGRVAVDFSNDQILLRLKTNSNDNSVMADFAYVNGGPIDISNTANLTPLTFIDVPGTGQIFTGENATRAEFRMLQPVEEVNIVKLTAGSPITISQLVDTTGDFSLSFDYRFELNTGNLVVELGGVELGTILAPDPASGSFLTALFTVNDSSSDALKALRNQTDLLLEITYNGDSGSYILIDQIQVTGILGLENSDFSGGNLDGWAQTGAGTAGVITLVAPAPEPGTFAIFGIGLAGLCLMRRRRRIAA